MPLVLRLKPGTWEANFAEWVWSKQWKQNPTFCFHNEHLYTLLDAMAETDTETNEWMRIWGCLLDVKENGLRTVLVSR